MNDNTKTLKNSSKISDDILDFYEYLMDNFMLPELRNRIRKNEKNILRESFQRGWMEFFKNKQKSHFTVLTKTKKNKEGIVVEKLVVCPSVFQIESTEKHKETTPKLIVPKASRMNLNPAPQLREVSNAQANAILSLNCTYTNKLLTIKPISINLVFETKDNDENYYLTQLQKELAVVEKKFEENYTKSMFLSNLFDTLAANGYIVVDGNDVTYMAAIYPNIAKYYPDFKKLSKQKQLVLLQQAAINGRKNSKKDIYTFAYSTFYALLKANCINTLVKYDPLSGKILTYKKVTEHYMLDFDGKKHIRVPNKNRLLFVVYQRPDYCTSFDSSVLCTVLTRKGLEHLEM